MTAHDLAASPEGQYVADHGFMLKGGRVRWESAVYSERGSRRKVIVSRLVPGEYPGAKLNLHERWIDPTTEVFPV